MFDVLRKIILVYFEVLYIFSVMLFVGMVCKLERLFVKLLRRRGGFCLDLCFTVVVLRRNRLSYSVVIMEIVVSFIIGLWGYGGK